MSENNQFENILPVAPLKIAALESCREFAQKVEPTDELIRRLGTIVGENHVRYDRSRK